MRIETIRMSDYLGGKGVPPIKLSVDRKTSVNITFSADDMCNEFDIEKQVKREFNRLIGNALVEAGELTREQVDEILKEDAK